MKNILITGAAGFIGSHAAEFYAQRSNENNIFAVDNLSRGRLLQKEIKNVRYNWDYLHKYPNIQFYENDIKDYQFLKELLKKNQFDIIIHTAAQTAVTSSLVNPKVDFENNILGTYNLLEATRLSNSSPAMVICSTNKVFGNNVNKCSLIEKEEKYEFDGEYKNGINEEFPIDLCEHTPYGASKLCSDLYFQEYGHTYGLKTGVFRMSCIYGTRQLGMEDQGWVAHFVISALLDKKINIFGDGKQVRDVLFVSDLINAFNAFIDKSNTLKHEVFCMGGGKNNTLSLIELLKILEKETGKKLITEFFDWRPSDQKVYISNIDKAQKLLNWKPEIDPVQGVRLLINWARKNTDLFA